MIELGELESLVIDGAGQEFKGDDFRSLRKPGVYVMMLGEEPLYVGVAKRILARIGCNHLQAKQAINQCDRLLLYPCVDHASAQKLESILIGTLRPKYNLRLQTSRLQYLLGCVRGTMYNRKYMAMAHQDENQNLSSADISASSPDIIGQSDEIATAT